jgi:hypothetical protein
MVMELLVMELTIPGLWVMEQQPAVLKVEFDHSHVNHQAESRACLDGIGKNFCRPFAGYADNADSGTSQ